MTKAQQKLLELASTEAVTIQEAARRIGTTVAAISNTRSCCRTQGWVKEWGFWQGPIEITDEGRAALADAVR